MKFAVIQGEILCISIRMLDLENMGHGHAVLLFQLVNAGPPLQMTLIVLTILLTEQIL